MLVRVVIAVLMLAGPLPVRPCTCDHAGDAPHHHDHDCPSSNPRPIGANAVVTPPADVPVDAAVVVAWVEPAILPQLEAVSHAPGTARCSARPSLTRLPLRI